MEPTKPYDITTASIYDSFKAYPKNLLIGLSDMDYALCLIGVIEESSSTVGGFNAQAMEYQLMSDQRGRLNTLLDVVEKGGEIDSDFPQIEYMPKIDHAHLVELGCIITVHMLLLESSLDVLKEGINLSAKAQDNIANAVNSKPKIIT